MARSSDALRRLLAATQDDPIIAIMLGDMLHEMGCAIVGEDIAQKVRGSRRAARTQMVGPPRRIDQEIDRQCDRACSAENAKQLGPAAGLFTTELRSLALTIE
jgi:hypothetical protein